MFRASGFGAWSWGLRSFGALLRSGFEVKEKAGMVTSCLAGFCVVGFSRASV